MGLFGDLFSKKACAFCGDENRIIGNRKLKDGNMCTDCAAKLSPWFSDRKESTVAEIGEQLKYREENAKALEDFWPNPAIGKEHFFYAEIVGEVPKRFVVSHNIDYRKDNADIIKFADVVSCSLDLKDRYEELKYANDKGERVSYNPPRYKYSYDFYVDMGIKNNPYFEEIRFKLNHFPVEVISEADTRGFRMTSHSDFDPSFNPEWREYKAMYDEIEALVNYKPATSKSKPIYELSNEQLMAIANSDASNEEKAKMFNDLMINATLAETTDPAQRAALERMRVEKQQAVSEMAAALAKSPVAAPASTPAVCPACNAPASGKFCEFCGEKLV